MEEPRNDLKHLAEWTEAPIPRFFKDLPPEQLHALREYVQNIADYETDGLEELYYTISTLIKYIPNFVLLPLITNYIKPPIAAGVCEALSLKEASKLASGLPAEYLGEVALHLESGIAADILGALKPALAEECMAYEIEHHPVKTLDIGLHANERLLKMAAKHLPELETVDASILDGYTDLIENIRSLEA